MRPTVSSDAHVLKHITPHLPHQHQRKVIVAIDFGTNAFGLGYTMIDDDEKQKGSILIDCEERTIDFKNKSDVLISYDGYSIAFGEKALNTYIFDSDHESSSFTDIDTDTEEDEYELLFYGYCRDIETKIDCIIPEGIIQLIYGYNAKYNAKIAKKPMLFHSIKTALSYQNIPDKIACVDGRCYSTSTIFTALFRYIKNHIFITFRRRNIQISNIEELQFILTVPAIWSDHAKHKMEQYALRAGLINGNIPNHLRFVYEPECVSISYMHECLEKRLCDNNDSSTTEDTNHMFKIGTRYILIDAGAGIVDIVCHQVNTPNCMDEIYEPTGGPWGSGYVDDEFETLLYEIFGYDAIMCYKEARPTKHMMMIQNFRRSKCRFYDDPHAKFHHVKLCYDFMDEIPEYCSKQFNIDMNDDDYDSIEEFEKLIKNAKPFGLETGHLNVDEDNLLISCEVWRKYLFDKVIDPMIDHVKYLINNINQIEDKDGKRKEVQYLCIAGGFAQSKYFQHRIYEAFGMSSYRLLIKIPKRPLLSVIDGALKLGLQSNYIGQRRLKYTYGVAVDRLITKVDIDKLPDGYLEKNSYIHPNTYKQIVRNLFRKYVEKNTAMDVGLAIEKSYKRYHKNERTSRIMIYCSNDPDPYVVTDKPVAHILVKFPEMYQYNSFAVRFYFGDTTIKAKALYYTDAHYIGTMEEDLEVIYDYN